MSTSSPSLSSLSSGYLRLVEPVSAGMLTTGTPIIVAAFVDGPAFLEAFASGRGPAGELAVRTRASPLPGTPMVLEIIWPGLPNRVFVRATALRRWLGGHLVLRFDAEEIAKRDYLVAMARGTRDGVVRRMHRRFIVRLPLAWRRFGEVVLHGGIAEDMSAGGLLIAGGEFAPPVGERVAVRLRVQAARQDLVFTGVVRHLHERAARYSFGVCLQYRSSAQQRTLRTLLRTFAGRGLVLVDPACD